MHTQYVQGVMVNWGRVADLTQRTIVWSMVGLTAYASIILVRGSYGMVQRYRRIKSLEMSPGDEVGLRVYTLLVARFN